MTYKTVADQFLDANGGNPIFAASAMALALMEDEPEKFKKGYPKESAVLTAVEQIPGLDVDSPSDVENVTLAVDVALKNRGGVA